MGKYLSKPVTSKELENGTGPGFQWGLAAMQGWRVTMEDMYIFEPTVPRQRLTHFVCAQNLKNVSIFGVSIFGVPIFDCIFPFFGPEIDIF